MLIQRERYRWSDTQHVLVVHVFHDQVDGDLIVEPEIYHPGCGDDDFSPGQCPIQYMVQGIGIWETVTGYHDQEVLDHPYTYLGCIGEELARQLLSADHACVPFKASYSCGTDYWGEWDEDLTIELPAYAA